VFTSLQMCTHSHYTDALLLKREMNTLHLAKLTTTPQWHNGTLIALYLKQGFSYSKEIQWYD